MRDCTDKFQRYVLMSLFNYNVYMAMHLLGALAAVFAAVLTRTWMKLVFSALVTRKRIRF